MRAAWQVGVEGGPLVGKKTENSPHFQTHKTTDEAPSHPGYILKIKQNTQVVRLVLVSLCSSKLSTSTCHYNNQE